MGRHFQSHQILKSLGNIFSEIYDPSSVACFYLVGFLVKFTFAIVLFLGTEKARIKAKIKAAEFAAKMKAEAEVKSQREAARLALQKVYS